MRTLVVIAIATALLCASTALHACSCEEDPLPREQVLASYFAASDIVAIFKVVGIERTAVQFGAARRSGRWVVLVPEHVFKGTVLPGQRFYAPAPPRFRRDSCDDVYEKRELVLVYTRANSPVALGGCSGNGNIRFRDLPLLFELAAGRS